MRQAGSRPGDTGTAPACGRGAVASICPGAHGRGRGCSAEEGRACDHRPEVRFHVPALPQAKPLLFGSQFPLLGDAGPGGLAQTLFEYVG